MVIVESAGISDIGRKRESNEDRICLDDDRGLYVVADGMGGHQAGEIASSLVAESICDFLKQPPPAGLAQSSGGNGLSAEAAHLLAGIEWSNRQVHQTAKNREDCRGMGSTVAAVYFAADTVIAANVGDSPIYLIRNGTIDLLSVAHTLSADMSVESYAAFLGNILTRALGPRAEVEADICELNCFKGDHLVLCSDGLSAKLASSEIMALATASPPAQACRSLVDLANARGGEDNVSVIVLHVTGIRRPAATALGRWVGRITQKLI